MNGTSRSPIPRRSVEPISICKPLQLTMPDRSPFFLITGLLPIPSTLVGSRELPEIGEKSSCFSIPSMADNALGWHSRVIQCRQSTRQGMSCSGLTLIAMGQADRLVLGLTDGNLLIAARRGDPTPIGGTFGSMDAWPAINGNIGTLNVATPGAQNGALSAHMAFNHCPSGTPTPSPTATATPSTPRLRLAQRRLRRPRQLPARLLRQALHRGQLQHPTHPDTKTASYTSGLKCDQVRN